MSLADNKLQAVHVIDPRVDVNAIERHQYGVLSSGNDNNFRQFPSSSFSNSTIDWTCNPPSRNTFVNRRAYKTMTWQLTFIGQSAGAGITLLQCAGLQPNTAGNTAYYDAPRCQPLANVVMTETITINGVPFVQNTGRFFKGLERYHNNFSNQDGDMSMTPTMPDQFQTYALGAGFARDPLRGYGDNPQECPRGGFIGCQVIRNDSTGLAGDTAIVNLILTEPFYVSPFLFGEYEEETAFIGVETMSVNMLLGGLGSSAFSGLVGSLWSHSPTSTSTFSSAVANLQSASLLFNYITPDLSQGLPEVVNYPWYNPTYYQTIMFANSTPSTNLQYTMNTITLSSIPNRIYLWVSPDDSLFNWTSSDVYFGITQVQVIFENRPVIMSQATVQDLYQMSKRNGCDLSYRQWTNDVGSVLCINFGNDFPLMPNQAPGLRGKFELQIYVNATNLSPNTYASQSLNVLVISEGIASISNNTVVQTLGVLNQQDVFAAKQTEPIKYKSSSNVYGGAFSLKGVLGFLKRAVRGAIDVGRKVVPHLAPQYAPAVEAAHTLASAVGVGRRRLGGAASGGRALSRKQMLSMMGSEY
jgi:hypothetical protein